MEAIEVRDVCALMSVWDMPATVRFYCDLLGFELVQRSPTYATDDTEELFHWCMLRTHNATIMLNTEYDEGERPVSRPVMSEHRFGTWFYYGCPDVDGAYEKLKAAGVECKPPMVTMYGFRALSFRDLDGRGITLQWPVEGEARG